jgi:hypothetical protein
MVLYQEMCLEVHSTHIWAVSSRLQLVAQPSLFLLPRPHEVFLLSQEKRPHWLCVQSTLDSCGSLRKEPDGTLQGLS